MSKTIFITGASSGLGKATAKLFHEKEWQMIATIRYPDKETKSTTSKCCLRRILTSSPIRKISSSGVIRHEGSDEEPVTVVKHHHEEYCFILNH
ncbi:hypothetical protein [Chryseosolibacter indicus]|uniref:hypothetical protein n=1 Tax=Chryseosolibacter indicus TaxID=2782351 RepID=UPI0034608F51